MPESTPSLLANPADSQYVTRAEALALLSVKPATLYTYVSRGLIRRVATPGRKQSFYYREDIERIRVRSNARASDSVLAAGAIRYGEPIVPTSITEITPDGPKYRSRNAIDLARAGTPFEAVAELLWTGMLLEHHPWQLEPLTAGLIKLANEPGRVAKAVSVHDAFAFVTLAAAMSGGSPSSRVTRSASPALAARQLILVLTGCFGFLARTPRYRAPRPNESVAQAIAASLGLPSTPKVARALDAALILCADHELNPATFVARITASSEGDLHSCIASAICANSGARIARSCDWLDQFLRGPAGATNLFPRPDRSTGDSDFASLGFNHPLYPRGDPRSQCLLQLVRELEPRSTRVRNILTGLEAAQTKHKQFPRLETALVVLAMALAIPGGAAGGLFTLGRIAGWVAHIAEQRLAGFLIRPRARFVAHAG